MNWAENPFLKRGSDRKIFGYQCLIGDKDIWGHCNSDGKCRFGNCMQSEECGIFHESQFALYQSCYIFGYNWYLVSILFN